MVRLLRAIPDVCTGNEVKYGPERWEFMKRMFLSNKLFLVEGGCFDNKVNVCRITPTTKGGPG